MPSFLLFHRNLCVLPLQCGDTGLNCLFTRMFTHWEILDGRDSAFPSLPSSLLLQGLEYNSCLVNICLSLIHI